MATVSLFWDRGKARLALPPRVLVTGFAKGMALGEPGDEATHRSVLKRAIDMLHVDAPLEELIK